ncbi:hypothetical protein BG015_009551, partial [Linnemannia schmuckeri]
LIIHHLTAQYAHKSVAALLSVNKYVCAATLPILYRDPFDIPLIHNTYSDYEKTKSVLFDIMKLVQVLLRSLPAPSSSTVDDDDGLVTELLRVFYYQDPKQTLNQDNNSSAAVVSEVVDSTETCRQDEDDDDNNAATPSTKLLLPPKTLLSYSSYMTRITFEEFSHLSDRQPFTLITPLLCHSNFQAFLQRSGRVDQYRAKEPFLRFLWAKSDEYKFFAHCAEREIRLDLAWAFCCSNAERIKTLHVPISDIGRYLTLIPRLKVLANVTFQVDKNLNVPIYWDQGTSKEKESLARLKEDRARHLEDMVLFVQEHQRYHRNVIQTAQCANDRVYQDYCPIEYQVRLFQFLPPLVKPQTLDIRNWIQFSARVAETDVSLVKIIALKGAPLLTYDLDRLMKQEVFLRRCRHLEQIALTTSSEDIFEWAVQERKDFDDATAATAAAAAITGNVHGDRAVVVPQQRLALVPLQSYNVEFNRSSSGRQASDALYAFGNTLQNINISFRTLWLPDSVPTNSDAPLFPEFKLGGSFDNNYDITPPPWLYLPQLESMDINTQDILLKLHPSLFARSPKLSYVSLGDQRSRYSFSDVVYWEPAHLPDLTQMSLVGTPAISFHPDTLKSTPKLHLLGLQMPFTESSSYIPDPEDFERYEEEDTPGDNNANHSFSSAYPMAPTSQRLQPIWTWDWDLPQLTHLTLTSEFAYRFEFRMLNGTPSLAVLTLDFNSETGRHDRTIGMEDLIKPGFQHPLLRQFIERDRQLHRMRERLISYLPKHEERCFVQQQQEDEDFYGDERLWREEFDFIHVPNLKYLDLNGPWKIDYRPFKAFFTKVAPNLENLSLPQAFGFTVPEWIKSTSESLHGLRDAYVSVPFSAQIIKALRLVSAVESEEAWDYGMRYKLAETPSGRKEDREPAVYSFRRQD